MPRQIIDTESSRPRYVRRMVLVGVLVLAAVGLTIALILLAVPHGAHPGPGK